MDVLLNTFILIIFIIFLGLISIEIKKKIDIPYTPIVMFFGILFGYYHNYIFIFSKGIENLLDINPYGILFIFVPGLVFETAFNIDHFIFKKQFLQVLILAGPGVMIGCFFNSFIFQNILNYKNEISWIEAFIFSSIFCSTDTVAVLSLLKELGISKKFSTLIKGENLLNDGTAMTFYLFFSNIYKGKVQSISHTILNFLKLSIGGPFFGIFLSIIFIIWLRKINDNYILLTSITLISCYITFIYSEIILNVSGILSIVFLGIFMGYFYKTDIKNKIKIKLSHVWEFIQIILEILLFFITGLFIGNTLNSFDKLTITYFDAFKVILFYIFLIFSRFLMILIFTPILNKLGPKIDIKEIFVLTYSGLRGGIALSFSLIIYIDDSYGRRFKEIVLYYMSGIVALTLLINGSTIKFLLKKINFEPKLKSKLKIENNLKKEWIIKIFKKTANLLYKEFKFIKIKKIFKNLRLKKKIKKIDKFQKKLIKLDLRDELFEEGLMRVYQSMKSYLNLFLENNYINKMNYYQIEEIIDYSMLYHSNKITLWDSSLTKLIKFNDIKLYFNYKDLKFIGKYIENFFIKDISNSYNIVTGLILIIDEIILNCYSFPLSNNLIKKVINELKWENIKFQKYLNSIFDSFPELMRIIQTKEAALKLISKEKCILKNLYKKGVIDLLLFKLEYKKLNHSIKNITFSKINWNIINLDILNLVFDGFNSLNFESKNIIRKNLREINFKENEHLLLQDNYISGIFIIIKGSVEEEIKNYKENLSFGSLINYSNIIKKDHKSICNCTSLTNVNTLFLDKNAILDLMKINKEFEAKIYKNSIISFLKYYEFNYFLNNLYILKENINNSKLMKAKKDDLICLEKGGILIQGKIKKINEKNEEVLKGFIVINAFANFFQVIKDSILLIYKIDVESSGREYISFKEKPKSKSIYNLNNEEKEIEIKYKNFRKNIKII